jgi:hypothetical protein
MQQSPIAKLGQYLDIAECAAYIVLLLDFWLDLNSDFRSRAFGLRNCLGWWLFRGLPSLEKSKPSIFAEV